MKINIYEFFEECSFSHGSWVNPSLNGTNKKTTSPKSKERWT